MNLAELKKRWIMGTIQPELFYIPWGEKKSGSIYIDLIYAHDNSFITGGIFRIGLSKQMNMYFDSETEQYIWDYNSNCWIFDKNKKYSFPVSSDVYVNPDLTQTNITVTNAEIVQDSITANSFQFTPTGGRIEITGLPCGTYYLAADTQLPAPMWYYGYGQLYLYPEGYEENSLNWVQHDQFQINKSTQLSGYDLDFKTGEYFNDGNDFTEYGYIDVSCVSPKLEGNILPAIMRFSEYRYGFEIIVYQQCLKDGYYIPTKTNSTWIFTNHQGFGGDSYEIYNNDIKIDNGRNFLKGTNTLKCITPPYFSVSYFKLYGDNIHFIDNNPNIDVEITENDYYAMCNGTYQKKIINKYFDIPEIKFEGCWMSLPEGVTATEESGNLYLAIKIYCQGEYKGYFMYGFYVGEQRNNSYEWYYNSNYDIHQRKPLYYNFSGENRNNDVYEIMVETPAIYPNSNLCKSLNPDLLNDFKIEKKKRSYDVNESVPIGHGTNSIEVNNVMILNIANGELSYYNHTGGHCVYIDSNSSNITAFDDILQCNCLNETNGIDYDNTQCQIYYYLGDGLTKNDCATFLSAAYHRNDSVIFTSADS